MASSGFGGGFSTNPSSSQSSSTGFGGGNTTSSNFNSFRPATNTLGGGFGTTGTSSFSTNLNPTSTSLFGQSQSQPQSMTGTGTGFGSSSLSSFNTGAGSGAGAGAQARNPLSTASTPFGSSALQNNTTTIGTPFGNNTNNNNNNTIGFGTTGFGTTFGSGTGLGTGTSGPGSGTGTGLFGASFRPTPSNSMNNTMNNAFGNSGTTASAIASPFANRTGSFGSTGINPTGQTAVQTPFGSNSNNVFGNTTGTGTGPFGTTITTGTTTGGNNMMLIGTGNPPYAKYKDESSTSAASSQMVACLVGMPAYRNKQLEEWRYEDYLKKINMNDAQNYANEQQNVLNRKKNEAGNTTFGGIGGPTTNTGGTAFGLSTTSTFNQQNQNQTQTTGSGFGTTNTGTGFGNNTTGSTFGTSLGGNRTFGTTNTGGFGQGFNTSTTSTPMSGGFGGGSTTFGTQPAITGNTWGTNASTAPTSGYGTTGTSGFGAFQKPAGGFGTSGIGGFGTISGTGGFGTSQGASGFGTSQGAGGFGTSSTGGFGNTFGANTTFGAGGAFGGTADALKSTTGLFGAPSAFGTNTNNATTNNTGGFGAKTAGGFGNFGATGTSTGFGTGSLGSSSQPQTSTAPLCGSTTFGTGFGSNTGFGGFGSGSFNASGFKPITTTSTAFGSGLNQTQQTTATGGFGNFSSSGNATGTGNASFGTSSNNQNTVLLFGSNQQQTNQLGGASGFSGFGVGTNNNILQNHQSSFGGFQQTSLSQKPAMVFIPQSAVNADPFAGSAFEKKIDFTLSQNYAAKPRTVQRRNLSNPRLLHYAALCQHYNNPVRINRSEYLRDIDRAKTRLTQLAGRFENVNERRGSQSSDLSLSQQPQGQVGTQYANEQSAGNRSQTPIKQLNIPPGKQYKSLSDIVFSSVSSSHSDVTSSESTHTPPKDDDENEVCELDLLFTSDNTKATIPMPTPDTIIDELKVMIFAEFSDKFVDNSHDLDSMSLILRGHTLLPVATIGSVGIRKDDVVQIEVNSKDGDSKETKSDDKKRCGPPKLLRNGYRTVPSIGELGRMTDVELSQVKNFTVSREGVGSIEWYDKTDVRGLDLDELIEIHDREIIVYKDETKKHPLGHGLNKKALITLYKVTVSPRKNTETEAEYNQRKVAYSKLVKQTSLEMDVDLISYDVEQGIWKFSVKHFSRYGVKPEEGNSIAANSMHKEIKPAMLKTKKMTAIKHLRIAPRDRLKYGVGKNVIIDSLKYPRNLFGMKSFKELTKQQNKNWQRIDKDAVVGKIHAKSSTVRSIYEKYKCKEKENRTIHPKNPKDYSAFMGQSFRVSFGPTGQLAVIGMFFTVDRENAKDTGDKVTQKGESRKMQQKRCISINKVQLKSDKSNFHRKATQGMLDTHIKYSKNCSTNLLPYYRFTSHDGASFDGLNELISFIKDHRREPTYHYIYAALAWVTMLLEKRVQGDKSQINEWFRGTNKLFLQNEQKGDVQQESFANVLSLQGMSSSTMKNNISRKVDLATTFSTTYNDNEDGALELEILNNNDEKAEKCMKYVFYLLVNSRYEEAYKCSIASGFPGIASYIYNIYIYSREKPVEDSIERQRLRGMYYTWSENGKLSRINVYTLQVIILLSGEIHELPLHLMSWFQTLELFVNNSKSLEAGIKQYQHAVQKGCANPALPITTPSHSKTLGNLGNAEQQAITKHSRQLDLLYSLLLLCVDDACTLDNVLNSVPHNFDPFDYQLHWYVLSILGNTKNYANASELDNRREHRFAVSVDIEKSVLTSFMAQLEFSGLWEYAVYVGLTARDPCVRYGLLRSVLLRHSKQITQRQDFLQSICITSTALNDILKDVIYPSLYESTSPLLITYGTIVNETIDFTSKLNGLKKLILLKEWKKAYNYMYIYLRPEDWLDPKLLKDIMACALDIKNGLLQEKNLEFWNEGECQIYCQCLQMLYDVTLYAKKTESRELRRKERIKKCIQVCLVFLEQKKFHYIPEYPLTNDEKKAKEGLLRSFIMKLQNKYYLQ